MFGKKKHNSLFSEVDDSRQIVYDFRRRTQLLFESYRPVKYKKAPTYDFKKIKEEDVQAFEKLVTAHALDAGNDDWIVERILGPVRAGICNLDDQFLEHMDFYTRQAERMAVDSADVDHLLELWRGKESLMEREHAETLELWNKYRGYNDREVQDNEE